MAWFLKKLLLLFSQLITVCVYLSLLLIVCLPRIIDKDLIRHELTTKASRLLSLPLEASGLQLSFFPQPTVKVKGLSFSPSENIEVRLDSLRLVQSWNDLLLGRSEIYSLQINRPVVTFEPATPRKYFPPDRKSLGTILQGLAQISKSSLDEGSFQIKSNGTKALLLENVSVNIQSGPLLEMTVRGESSFCKQFSLNLTGDSQSLDFLGELEISSLRLEKAAAFLPPAYPDIDSGLLDLSSSLNITSGILLESDFQGQVPAITLNRKGQATTLQLPVFQGGLQLSPEKGRISFTKMQFTAPGVHLKGSLDWNRHPDSPFVRLSLSASDFHIQPVQEACLSLFENKTLRKVSNIVTSGWVPEMTIKTNGGTRQELINRLHVQGVLEKGEVRVPEPEMHLTNVNGSALIQDKTLYCKGVRSVFGESRGENGELVLDLDKEHDIFSLKTKVWADLSQLPGVLKEVVSSKKFLKKLNLFTKVSGRGQGFLSIQKENSVLNIEAALQQGQVLADYKPLPFPLLIGPGRLTWTKSEVILEGFEIGLGKSRFHSVSAEFLLNRTNRFSVQASDSTLDLGQILPFIQSVSNEQRPWNMAKFLGRLHADILIFRGALHRPAEWDYHSTGQVERLRLQVQGLEEPILIQDGGFVASKPSLTVTDVRTEYRDLSADFSGSIRDVFGQNPAAEFTFEDGFLGPESLSEIANHLPLPDEIRFKSPLKAKKGSLVLKDFSLTSLRVSLNTGNTVLDCEFQAASPRTKIFDFRILDEFSKARLEVTHLGPGLLDIRFTGHLLQESLDRLFQTSRYSPGNVLGYCSLKISFSEPWNIRSASGRIHLRDTVLPVAGSSERVNIEELTLKALQDKLLVGDGTIFLGTIPVDVRAEFDYSGENSGLRASVQARELRWEKIEPIIRRQFGGETGRHDTRLRSGLNSLKAGVDISLDAFHYKDLTWKPLEIRLDLDKNKKEISFGPRANLCAVRTPGNLSLENGRILLRVDPEADRQDLSRTLRCMYGWEDDITGYFSLEGSLKAEAGDLEGLKDSVQGGISFSAEGGRIHRFTILAKVLEILNSTEILFGSVPDLEKQGFAYNTLDIECLVKDSILIIKEGHLDGQSMNIDFMGQYIPGDKRIELMLAVAPFKTLDRLVTKIPVLKHITGQSLISIPFKITGSLDRYRITPLPPGAVGKGFLNVLEKTLNLPVKIIQPLIPN
ncbi:MAG: AsmA-like C-terminal domain-containing protein [Desulfohalobiaceae bacterium]|nr:AsmA-like C-terminal domain-containing protein [Desulfohalobiaceae bacterium]